MQFNVKTEDNGIKTHEVIYAFAIEPSRSTNVLHENQTTTREYVLNCQIQ